MQPQQPYSGPPYPQPQPPETPEQPMPMPAPLHSANSPIDNYDFIINPQKTSRRPLQFISNGSKLTRIVFALVGILVLLILIVLIKNLLAGNSDSNLPDLLNVAQEQQEIIHIVTNANNNQEQSTLSVSNQNVSTTAQLSLPSEQSQLLAYLKLNGHKITTKQLGLKISASVDNELDASIAASTYDQTFTQVMQSQLTIYEESLRQAYQATAGPKGRQLLKADYSGADLLLQQINSPGS